MRRSIGLGLAAACAAALVAAPVAAGLDTTVRVEGRDANLVPESAVSIEGEGTASVFDRNSAEVQVSRASAFWQLYRTASAGGVTLGFEYFPAFSSLLVQRIGPDENAGAVGWQYKVNHVSPATGPDARALARGDSVLWYYGGADATRELDVTASSDRVAKGAAFTVSAVSYGSDGASAPAAGAQLRYGGATATADAAGRATFIASGAGVAPVSAARAGDIRSAVRAVCSYDSDPTVCNLPPARPGPPPPSPPGPAPTVPQTDSIAPGSAVTFPRAGRRYASVRALAGTAGPDRSDVAGVEVALARRVGTLCRFSTRSGALTAPRSCARRLWVPARSSGARWLAPARRGKGLPPGLWRFWSRATDGAGNREATFLARVNTGQFAVVATAVRR